MINIRRFVFVIIGIFFLLGSATLAGLFSNNKGEILIENKGTELVVHGEVDICGQKFAFEKIKPGDTRQFSYKVKSDSHYKILVEFESGKKLTKDLGYVTNGLDFKDALIVTEDDILLEKIK